MKNFILTLSLVVGLASGAAKAAALSPGDWITPVPGGPTIYTGTVYKTVASSFLDSYFIDFTQYPNPDVWTFQAHAYGITYNGQPFGSAGGLTSLSMSFYDTTGGGNTLMWTEANPANILNSSGPIAWVDQGESHIHPALPLGTYRLDVTGGGKGTYLITLSVPEPETWAIFIAGLALVGLRLRSQKMQ